VPLDTDLRDKTRNTLLERIGQTAPTESDPKTLLILAEAWAWTVSPDNSHAGGGKSHAATQG
jgi:hypothetical protein